MGLPLPFLEHRRTGFAGLLVLPPIRELTEQHAERERGGDQ
jgi:hypothetical protein